MLLFTTFHQFSFKLKIKSQILAAAHKVLHELAVTTSVTSLTLLLAHLLASKLFLQQKCTLLPEKFLVAIYMAYLLMSSCLFAHSKGLS
jgi:hypothetical protein